ncbi:hypothetical protein DDE82_007451 [Stemphylium lycopersici]|uniref:Uncharacterized protein n=1 Tax=Stemphylium lycopersici TaxID=183478 RepID=A0A364N1L1_STELY|nr:hypothetical protein TW65_01270 [Stemphylium lycopersici]RAR00292.1 hypothetical protein DDE82_007451 [Stemphylium lycopersici]RAR09379.1 hypothetical protein DDE83_005531 [Stemphylium lycopersici]
MTWPYRPAQRSSKPPFSPSSAAVNRACPTTSASTPTAQADGVDSGPAPILYLTGFSCVPSDREYAEARRATGNPMPYWFEESGWPRSYLNERVRRRASLVIAGVEASVAVARLDEDGVGGRGEVGEGGGRRDDGMGRDKWKKMERVRERELLGGGGVSGDGGGRGGEGKISKKERSRRVKEEKKKAEADTSSELKRPQEDASQQQPRPRLGLRSARRLVRLHDLSSEAVEMGEQPVQSASAAQEERQGREEVDQEHGQQAHVQQQQHIQQLQESEQLRRLQRLQQQHQQQHPPKLPRIHIHTRPRYSHRGSTSTSTSTSSHSFSTPG